MNKHLKTFHELHHKHHITHRVLSLTMFAIIVMLAVYGLAQVRAEQAAYEKVPNGDPGVCFKVGTNFNDPINHVSCKSYQQVCQTNMGALVECRTGNLVTE